MPEQHPTSNIEDPKGRFVLTPEQRQRAVTAFEKAIDASVLADDVGQLGLFDEDDETYIRREVERMLYEQKLPNGGDKEPRMIERLKEIGNKADRGWAHISINLKSYKLLEPL